MGTLAVLVAACFPGAAQAATFSDVSSEPGVVWITDVTPPIPADRPAMHQTSRAFVPQLLIVPVGSSVIFPNDDPFIHSVYSTSPSNPFDLGLYENGPGKAVTFAAPGIVEVRCHIHGSMHATIVVVDGPYARTAVAGDRYVIDGVRPGRHTLHTWSAEHGESTRPVVVR